MEVAVQLGLKRRKSQELKKEEQCRLLSKRAFQSQQAASADSRLKAAAEVPRTGVFEDAVALARSGSAERQVLNVPGIAIPLG
ncbi:hypothetical protein AK812_SmicGene46342 [Symbiodinium microadriaticum]|uniref:Uncharacterized protein n=1 Tax=Symbiodinium microadriaticum TaxID=2951 RepID=A0A1Q9BU55_SYMMI|nr:hypothetical protein AK812_SmicGene46342 [Symbiodinium microadriaticum]